MYADFLHVLTFFIIVALLVWTPLYLGSLFRPKFPFKEKQDIYECGEPTIGSSWVRYNIRFYQTALIFLLFDVELVFLVPVALWLRPAAVEAGVGNSPDWLPWLVFGEIAFFVLVLAIGLAYAWRFGGLDWISGRDDAPEVEMEDEGGGAADDGQGNKVESVRLNVLALETEGTTSTEVSR